MSQQRYNKYRMDYGGARGNNIDDFYPRTYYCQQPVQTQYIPVQTQYIPVQTQYIPVQTQYIPVQQIVTKNGNYPNNVMVNSSYMPIVQTQRCFIYNPYTGRYELP